MDLTQPVVISSTTNPIRPFAKCGSSEARTMIGDYQNPSIPETIAMYRIDYDEVWSSSVDRYHGQKLGSTTCNSITKELYITR